MVFEALDAKQKTVTDSGWRAQVLVGSLTAATMLVGAAKVRPWLDTLAKDPARHAEGLGRVAEGLARAGHDAEARAAIADCREAQKRAGLNGEAGTLVALAQAFAYDALGDAQAVEAALAEAEAYARREKHNPRQPWSHLVRGYARLGRDAALAAHFKSLNDRHLSFEDADAAQAVVAGAVKRGDVAGYKAWRARLDVFSGYETHEALKGSALAAVKAGHGEALFAILSDFADHPSYSDYVADAVCLTLAGEGHLPLARRILEAMTAQAPRPSEILKSLQRMLAAPGAARGAQEGALSGSGESFIRAFRARHAVDPTHTLALASQREAALRAGLSTPSAEPAQDLVALGAGLAQVGEAARGVALIDEAVQHLAALKGGEKSTGLRFVGPLLTGHGFDAQALFVLRKMSTKFHRTELAKLLSLNYVSAKDFVGAVAVVGLGEDRPLSQAMRLSDALSHAAGQHRWFKNFA